MVVEVCFALACLFLVLVQFGPMAGQENLTAWI